MNEIVVEVITGDYWRRAEMFIPEYSRLPFVTVYQIKDWKEPHPWEFAEINWGALGMQPVVFTRTFIACLNKAIEIAEQWNKDVPA